MAQSLGIHPRTGLKAQSKNKLGKQCWVTTESILGGKEGRKEVGGHSAALIYLSKGARLLIPHGLLVFLNEFLLLFFLLHPVLTWNDKVRCDPAFGAGPGNNEQAAVGTPSRPTQDTPGVPPQTPATGKHGSISERGPTVTPDPFFGGKTNNFLHQLNG